MYANEIYQISATYRDIELIGESVGRIPVTGIYRCDRTCEEKAILFVFSSFFLLNKGEDTLFSCFFFFSRS